MQATVYRRRRIPAALRRIVANNALRTAPLLMVTSLIVTSLIVTSLIVTACSATATTTEASTTSADAPAIVAAESPTPAATNSPTFPDGGVTAANVLRNPDGAAIDDALAELEARKRDDQVIIQSDFDGCDLGEAQALPLPDSVMVLLAWEPVDCAIAIKYRALFVLDATGENQHGPWDYLGTVPPVVVSSIQN